MKVLWISDFGIKHNIGGAQRSNQLVIEEGQRQGHHIIEFNYDSEDSILRGTYDLVVSSNLEVLSRRLPEIIKYIASNGERHARIEHDSNRYLQVQDRELLFGNCSKSFFLTKFHYNQFIEMYGDIFQNIVIVPDPIDTNFFYDTNKDREEKVLYIGYMHYLKGTNNFFEYVMNNPSIYFVMAAWGDAGFEQVARSFSNVEWLGQLSYEEMPSLYNKYKTMYYHPVFFEPFCRAVGEALLCGMEIDGNDLIGSLHHYNEVGKEEFISGCNNATQSFWKNIDELCNSNC